MIRRALIIYCDNTSTPLVGPVQDFFNLTEHLTSRLGGEWRNDEILGLRNPTIYQVRSHIQRFMNNADYTFIVYSGHGGTSTYDNRLYLELLDDDIAASELRTNARRQTRIVDTCRTLFTPEPLEKSYGMGDIMENFSGSWSTRELFDQEVLACEQGLTALFAASPGEAAADSHRGGAYLYSILKVCQRWSQLDGRLSKFSVKNAHEIGIPYMTRNFDTIQNPVMNYEKRRNYFPLAVKFNQV